MQVVCVRTGSLYTPEYVLRLRDSVWPYRLFCVTDQPEEIEGVTNITAPPGVTGWWVKLWLYSMDAPHPCFTLDLDITILKPIRDFLVFDEPFTIRDFFPGGVRPDKMNGSVCLIPRYFPGIWECYQANQKEVERTHPTDQHYLWHSDIPWNFYPNEWCQSYRRGNITDKTKIVVWHGRPKPHEMDWSPFRTHQCPPE